jgi:hypothetical protein
VPRVDAIRVTTRRRSSRTWTQRRAEARPRTVPQMRTTVLTRATAHPSGAGAAAAVGGTGTVTRTANATRRRRIETIRSPPLRTSRSLAVDAPARARTTVNQEASRAVRQDVSATLRVRAGVRARVRVGGHVATRAEAPVMTRRRRPNGTMTKSDPTIVRRASGLVEAAAGADGAPRRDPSTRTRVTPVWATPVMGAAPAMGARLATTVSPQRAAHVHADRRRMTTSPRAGAHRAVAEDRDGARRRVIPTIAPATIIATMTAARAIAPKTTAMGSPTTQAIAAEVDGDAAEALAPRQTPSATPGRPVVAVGKRLRNAVPSAHPRVEQHRP